MFTDTSSFVIFEILLLIFSISEPFLPITKPGLEVWIETTHFFDDLYITISETPALVIFFLINCLIL